MNKSAFYRELVQEINQTVGREAVTADQLRSLVYQAKMIRQSQGLMGLLSFANQLPSRFLTPQEVQMIQRSPRYRELSNKTIQMLVLEGVIKPFEANMVLR
ncbi:hypothetical protein [Laceyella putida]|uniref:Uncharacterized protein n=1 Tax=Laceyella putida TaxID=110101 RepID=A0ABW2RMU7_9BACL